MLWLICIVVLVISTVCWVKTVRNSVDCLTWEPGPAIIAGLALVIVAPIIFCVTQASVARMEAFWQTNQVVYVETIELTKAATVQSVTAPIVQLENMKHSTATADRIREYRDNAVKYNAMLAFYRKWEHLNWLVGPVFRYPDEECQPVTLTGLR